MNPFDQIVEARERTMDWQSLLPVAMGRILGRQCLRRLTGMYKMESECISALCAVG